jgi:hypothetical protein
MVDLLRDPLWQFVGAVLVVVALMVSVTIFFAEKKRKELSYEILSHSEILSATEEIEGKLKILFKGEVVRNVHLLIVKLINSGNTPITSTDYERNFQ